MRTRTAASVVLIFGEPHPLH